MSETLMKKPEGPYAEELKTIATLVHPKEEDITSRQVFLGEKTKKYTLFFDLDETLVCARGNLNEDKTEESADFLVKVRPMASELIANLSKKYEIAIFTAGSEEYAQKIVSGYIDPDREYIKAIVSQKHCVPNVGGVYVKDLRVIADRKIEEMLIVDNSIVSFAFQLANGIPVSPYCGDDDEMELLYLEEYLLDLCKEDDILKANRENIGLL